VNVLDENIIESQRQLLRRWRIAVRHLGYDMGRQGMQDEEIMPFVHRLRQPTFFTRDLDFDAPSLCHRRYCLVYMAVKKDEVALFVRRFLRHGEFDTAAKRMGTVIWVSHVGLAVWRLHAEQETHFAWTT
jgi:hypothetical protein